MWGVQRAPIHLQRVRLCARACVYLHTLARCGFLVENLPRIGLQASYKLYFITPLSSPSGNHSKMLRAEDNVTITVSRNRRALTLDPSFSYLSLSRLPGTS